MKTWYCTYCEGQGEIIVGEYTVSRDMAIDAGEPGMEGMSIGFAYDTCYACGGMGYIVEDGEENEKAP